MPAALQRLTDVEQLLAAPHRFDFFQAVRLMVAWLEQQGIPADQALADHVSFENSLSFAFPPGEIAALAVEGAQQIHLTPAFIGLLGASGTLPHHYTERIAAYQSATKDEAPRAFFDMFSNRAVAQFYLAWRKHRVELAGPADDDAFLPLLLSLAGFKPGAGIHDDFSIPDELIARYAGAMMQRPVTPGVLGGILSDYLQAPLAIDESTGRWLALHEPERCALGGGNATLGYDTLLGSRSWRPDLGARIRIGPLRRPAFDKLMPGAVHARALAQLLRLFGNPAIVYEVRLTLAAADIQPIRLAGGDAPAARLGQDSFMVAGSEDRDRSDMYYRITPLAPLPAPSQRPPPAAARYGASS